MALAMRCNCQMSFSSSFERPRFKLRSQRKRIAKTKRMGRPMARVARTMVISRGSGDWVMVIPPKAGLQTQNNSYAAPVTNGSQEDRRRRSRLFLAASDPSTRGGQGDSLARKQQRRVPVLREVYV